MRRRTRLAVLAVATAALGVPASAGATGGGDLWRVYDEGASPARSTSTSRTRSRRTCPVWSGFGPSVFRPAVNPATGQAYTYANDGFEATSYTLATDQFGTQFDPPAHWAPEQAAIDEIPGQLLRPQARRHRRRPSRWRAAPEVLPPLADVKAWEHEHGRIPAGSVVMVRSDWSKRWTDDPVAAKALAADGNFPSVALDTLEFLRLQRHILFHGHEPLDTDSTPTLEGEAWLMHHGYAQAEGVANLEGVPADRLPRLLRLPQVQGRPGRLRALHRDLPAVDGEGRAGLRRRRTAPVVHERPALGHDPGVPRAITPLD